MFLFFEEPHGVFINRGDRKRGGAVRSLIWCRTVTLGPSCHTTITHRNPRHHSIHLKSEITGLFVDHDFSFTPIFNTHLFTVVKILKKIMVFMIHSLPCTVSNEMKTNQFYEPQPYFPTDVEPCHSLPLCLLEFLRGTINHFNQRVHYNELIHIPSYRKQKNPQKRKYIYIYIFF